MILYRVVELLIDFLGLCMSAKAIKEEAEKLIRDQGQAAYDKACEAMRAARRHRNVRLEEYLAKVAQEIARCTGREMDVDTHRPIGRRSSRTPSR